MYLILLIHLYFRCLERMLNNWDALKVYFAQQKQSLDDAKKAKKERSKKSQKVIVQELNKNTKQTEKTPAKSITPEEPDSPSPNDVQSYAEKKVEAIFCFVKSPTNKLYMLFLNYTVHVFDDVLRQLQTEEPMIHVLRRKLLQLLQDILSRFVKPSAFTFKGAEDVEYKLPYNQKANQDLIIGEAATKFIENKSENHLRDSRLKEFYGNVRKYFELCVDYMKQKLPLNDELLKHAEVCDVANRKMAKSSDLLFFLKKFPCLIPEGATIDSLLEQFASYQIQNIDSCIEDSDRIDETWVRIGSYKNESGIRVYSHLSLVMRGVLTIPHSSAHCERVFSCVRKNRTEQRSSLSDKTLESLLVMKSCKLEPESATPCFMEGKALDRLKGAYYRSLNQ